MKKLIKLISFLMLIFCISNVVQAFEPSYSKESCQKHYILASHVHIANNGIFVNFEGTMLNVCSIFIDEIGAYIAGLGSCYRCGFPNDDMGKCQNPKCPN